MSKNIAEWQSMTQRLLRKFNFSLRSSLETYQKDGAVAERYEDWVLPNSNLLVRLFLAGRSAGCFLVFTLDGQPLIGAPLPSLNGEEAMAGVIKDLIALQAAASALQRRISN